MSTWKNSREYAEYLRSLGPLPEGFRGGTTSLTFMPVERPSEEPYRMDLSAILLDEPSESFAGVFTKNAVPGAPVLIARERIESPGMQGVLINNRISNVAAADGMATARRLADNAGKLLGIDGGGLFPSSTGIIGWRLPETEMIAAMPALARSVKADPRRSGLPYDLARAIMTTDSFPKLRVRRIGKGRILGIAKGAGMIEPNMATMLAFILTDLDVPRNALREILLSSLEESFNSISVDGDQSTSDMVLAFSSRRFPVELSDFAREFTGLCRDLSRDIVRNGEGTGHVLEITVRGNHDAEFLRMLGRAVGNSPLVKTAVYGNDPNVGRILSALGDAAGNAGRNLDTGQLEIRIGDQTVFHRGVFDLSREKEALLAGYLAENSQNPRITGYPQNEAMVRIDIDLGKAGSRPGKTNEKKNDKTSDMKTVRIYASDLGHEYVRENADYRT
jgi:glutamate N-acetyltransferase/amino-acid N-acetyltransferase